MSKKGENLNSLMLTVAMVYTKYEKKANKVLK